MNEIEYLVPAVAQKYVNDDILLYEGTMLLHSGFDVFQKPDAIGKAVYAWFPFPRVTYDLTLIECHGFIAGEFEIEHEKLSKPVAFYKLREDHNGKIKGFIDLFEIGNSLNPFTKIQFQIPNIMPISKGFGPDIINSNQLKFIGEHFCIVLQSSASKDQVDSLQKGSGFILSGILEISCEGCAIKLADVSDLISIFCKFISFFNGQKVKALITTGFDRELQPYRAYVSEPSIQAFLPVRSWAPNQSEDEVINEAWNTFYGLWKIEEDKDSLELAIHWYLEALSQKSGLEASIMLIQNALELLSSRILVEREFILDQVSSEKLSASSKFNVLLNWAKIQNQIPSTMSELTKHAKANNLRTGAEIITYVRNSIVHPHPKNREKYKKLTVAVKFEAFQLGIYYVELIILRILNYKGRVYNRIGPANIPDNFKDTFVPWMI